MAFGAPDTKEEADQRYNPADTANDLYAKENVATDQIDNDLGDSGRTNDINSASDSLNNQESAAGKSEFYEPSVDKNRDKLKSTIKMAKNSKGIIAIVGIFISVLAAFSSLLPLKLNSLLDNIDQQLESVAQYSVEERLEYITTRWITQRVMKTAYPGDDNIVFCKGGGIICSLTSTKYSAWFEQMLDATFEKDGINVRVTIDAHGRSGPTQIGRASCRERV